ncbi:MAG: hypothetical protein ACFFC3_10950 [Candidatus Odinarchaeota archaeon]
MRFCLYISTKDVVIKLRPAGSSLEGFRSMQNRIGRNRIEQIAEADLLAVTLFADVWFMIGTKGFR